MICDSSRLGSHRNIIPDSIMTIIINMSIDPERIVGHGVLVDKYIVFLSNGEIINVSDNNGSLINMGIEDIVMATTCGNYVIMIRDDYSILVCNVHNGARIKLYHITRESRIRSIFKDENNNLLVITKHGLGVIDYDRRHHDSLVATIINDAENSYPNGAFELHVQHEIISHVIPYVKECSVFDKIMYNKSTTAKAA